MFFPFGNSLSQQTFVLMKMCWRRLLSLSWEEFKTSWSRRTYSPQSYVFRRRLQNVLVKTNIFVLVICLQDLFKTFSRCLQHALPERLQDIFKMYHQVILFLLTGFRDVFNMFLRSTAKTVMYKRIWLGHTSEKFMISVQTLQEWKNFSSFSFSLYYTF